MQSIINFNKAHGITDGNNLNCYSAETINIISDIIKGKFKSYHTSSNALNNSQTDFGEVRNYIGLYFKHVLKDNLYAELYFLIAINEGEGNIHALNNLTNVYIERNNYELAEKYCVLVINKGNNSAINILAYVYAVQKKYDLAEEYYILAIRKGIDNAMNNLADMYVVQNKCDLAGKYYAMAISDSKNIANVIRNVDTNLEKLRHDQQKYELARKKNVVTIKNEKGNKKYFLCSTNIKKLIKQKQD